MVNILDEQLTTVDTYYCQLCDSRGSKFCKGQMKNIIGHFDSITHKNFFGNDVLNKQIMDLIKDFRSKRSTQSAESAPEEIVLEKSSKLTVQRVLPKKSANNTELLFSISKFLVENRLPNSIAERLLKFVQDTVQDYEVKTIEECSISKAIATKIIKNCICETIKEELLHSLQQSAYSILLDESTDSHGVSYLAVCVKFISPKNVKNPVTKLLTLLQLGENQTAETLFQMLEDEILSKDPKLQRNLVGLVTDQGSNMCGCHNGLGAKLKARYPQVVPVNDLSHIYHLICKSSLKSFPQEIISMVKDLSSFFNYSSQRRAKLMNIQKELGREKIVNIKEYTPIRWLSLAECLASIDDLWVPLNRFFERFGDEEEVENFSSKNYAYLRALLILIEKLTFYNKVFQNPDLFYDQVVKNIQEGFVVFGRMILREDKSFEEIYEMPFETNNLVSLSDFILSINDFKDLWLLSYPEFNYITAEMGSAEEVDMFFKDIRIFILRILSEMKKRIPLYKPVLREASVVFLKRYSREDWWFLLKQFSNILNTEETRVCKNEIDRLAITYQEIEAEHKMLRHTPLQMWHELTEVYPQLAKLARAVLVLPHSSASVERIFSQLKDFKTQKRNRLSTKNLEAALLSYQGFGGDELVISEDMIQKYDGVWAKSQNMSPGVVVEERKEQILVIAQREERENDRQEREAQRSSDLGDIVRSIMITEFQNLKSSLRQRAYDLNTQDIDGLMRAPSERIEDDDVQSEIGQNNDPWLDLKVLYERKGPSNKTKPGTNLIPPDRKRVKRNDDDDGDG